PQGLCTKYGYGCAMCVLRCPTFGARVSIAAKAGVKEGMSRKANGQVGSVSGGTHLLKETVAPELVKELEQNGHILIPIPEHLKEKLAPKTELAHNTVGHDEGRSKLREYLGVVDDGMFKFMQRPFMPLPFLRQVEGLEKAVYYDPISGGSGNSVRFLSLAPRDDGMRVSGMENLFVGGEKQGLMVGHPEAHVTGLLAGHNAARFALGIAPLVLPRSTVIGEGIAYTREKIYENGEVHVRYDFMAGTLYKQIRELGLYELDPSAVRRRVAELGLEGVMAGQGM
ncbi:MAG: FAD-dependent oxidoreductase, partial [Firmicutes bacterium]|nr:FAD-dependent oxidoreductase [Bacillota bacterium]